MALQKRIFKAGKISVEHFYLCNYRPKRSGRHDRLSQSLLRFKHGLDPDVKAWIACSVAELSKLFRNSNATVMHALGHQQTVSDEENSIAKLCTRLSCEVGLQDGRHVLYKQRPTSKLSLLSMHDRFKEISGNYFLKEDLLPSHRILIIDDILTTGATMTAIIDAIRCAVSSPSIKIFTLACCDYVSLLNNEVTLAGYSYRWQLERGWFVNEMDAGYGETFESLCNRIMRDEFDQPSF